MNSFELLSNAWGVDTIPSVRYFEGRGPEDKNSWKQYVHPYLEFKESGWHSDYVSQLIALQNCKDLAFPS